MVQVQLAVGADPAEVGRARQWVRGRLLALGADPTADYAETLVLLVSELVTNAVVHTGHPAVLRLLWPRQAGPVRVEVADASGVAPAPRAACGEATNGRGLELVELLAARWGWSPQEAGKLVWCEVDVESGPCQAVSTPVLRGAPGPAAAPSRLDRVQTAGFRSSTG
ncbi:anti-sigma regulatory factor (Ser/Thr protein kinase) [Kitasatospora viridis]|uniref:Anti-sigma regulatory factor (Ser/Thr protein kinase) n=1 Tax=Kitasatospora viridis TaxID=281105 RepID=A0A561UGA7_9ACTN|nr:anti-sigma regulatory factor (Ser/Thr protein kinase) [Kitasatospora viridis]